jgi:hypothetical protein
MHSGMAQGCVVSACVVARAVSQAMQADRYNEKIRFEKYLCMREKFTLCDMPCIDTWNKSARNLTTKLLLSVNALSAC